jgi:NAD(P)-dependent dehydrogenase (short-subunit alcohol dehydrogenase family)
VSEAFAGQVALVTGAGSGIGRATALAFAQKGALVAAADRGADRGEETAQKIRRDGGEARFFHVDVAIREDVERFLEAALDAFGRIDHAFNNAGILGRHALTHETIEADWARVLSVNLTGTWHCMRAEIPIMIEQGAGSIVNCASIAGLRGFETRSAYSASKHGIIGLTRSAALEYAKEGIRVNAVCPGAIDTPLLDEATGGTAEGRQAMVDFEPVGRVGRPEEVAAAVLWLCGPDSGFVTGAAIPIDGGLSAQ